jgi:glucokinase
VPYEKRIVEDFVSARAIAGNYERRTGKTIPVVQIAAAAPYDLNAQEAFAEFGHHLGRVIGSLLADFLADVVVLGGNIARSAHLFLPAAQAEIANQARQIRVSELLDLAPLVGCAVATFEARRQASACA